jgi:hypothetical protein
MEAPIRKLIERDMRKSRDILTPSKNF